MGSCNLPELAQQHEQHKNVVFLVFSHDGDEEIGGCAQKIDLRPKKKRFWAQKGPLWAIGAGMRMRMQDILTNHQFYLMYCSNYMQFCGHAR